MNTKKWDKKMASNPKYIFFPNHILFGFCIFHSDVLDGDSCFSICSVGIEVCL